MSENETAWYLCNSLTQYQSSPLSSEEARKQCSEILEADAGAWHVWQDTWPAWKRLSEVAELHSLARKKRAPPPIPTAATPPPMPKAPPPLPAAASVVEIPTHMKETPAKQPQNRKHPRHEIRLRVIIRNAQMTFRTFSKDLSLGGIALEDAVPPHLFETGCQIFIAGPEGYENLRFELGPTSRNDLRYFSFSNLDEKFVQKLSHWLEKYSKKVPTKTSA